MYRFLARMITSVLTNIVFNTEYGQLERQPIWACETNNKTRDWEYILC